MVSEMSNVFECNLTRESESLFDQEMTTNSDPINHPCCLVETHSEPFLIYCYLLSSIFNSSIVLLFFAIMVESTSRPVRVIAHFLEEVGLVTMWHSSLDVKLLCAQRFVRLFAYGGSTLILASYLSALGITDDRIGLFMTLTLIGDVVISFFLTLFADRMGRKAVLSLGSALMAGSGVVFALTGNFWILLAAAVFGVISPRYVLYYI